MNFYELNTLVRASVAFTSPAGQAIDPSEVTCYVLQPDGVEVAYNGAAVQKTGTGAYFVDLDCSMAGVWKYKWEGRGVVEAATPDVAFVVNLSELVGSLWPTSAPLAGHGALLLDDAGIAVE